MDVVKDSVCGMDIDVDSAAAQETYLGVAWYFCSESCHNKFQADPAQYARPETLTDPVCGMEVPKDSSYHTEHAGQQYHFCCESCLGKFEAEPNQYV